MIREYLLTTNKFLKPKVLQGTDAMGVLLIRLLTMVPGTNPRHPAMGVGIGTLYRFILESDLLELQQNIEDQVSTYLPVEFRSVAVKLKIDSQKYLSIGILIDDTMYTFDTKDTDTPVLLSDIIPQ